MAEKLKRQSAFVTYRMSNSLSPAKASSSMQVNSLLSKCLFVMKVNGIINREQISQEGACVYSQYFKRLQTVQRTARQGHYLVEAQITGG